MGLKILCGLFPIFSLNDEIFRRILLIPQNIVTNLNNVRERLLIRLTYLNGRHAYFGSLFSIIPYIGVVGGWVHI